MSEKRTFKHKNVTNNNIVNRKGENIMNKTTFRKEDEVIKAGTFDDYFVCDEKENEIGKLSEYDA